VKPYSFLRILLFSAHRKQVCKIFGLNLQLWNKKVAAKIKSLQLQVLKEAPIRMSKGCTSYLLYLLTG